MKLLVPGSTDEQDALRAWNTLATYVKDTFSWEVSTRKVFRLVYGHQGEKHTLEVSASHPANKQTVVVILETREASMPYLVLTQTRGVERGVPFLVGKDEVESVTEFE